MDTGFFTAVNDNAVDYVKHMKIYNINELNYHY